jgi:hypothetical protein
MTADCPYYFSPAQASQTMPYQRYGESVDWRALLRMNLPAISKVAPSESKQVLAVNADTVDSIAEEFPKLVKQWKDETAFHSSLSKKFTNPAYVRIMAMGKPALPLILSELQKNSGHWFYALKYIAGKDVAAESNAQSFEEARAAWLEWGYKNNHI